MTHETRNINMIKRDEYSQYVSSREYRINKLQANILWRLAVKTKVN